MMLRHAPGKRPRASSEVRAPRVHRSQVRVEQLLVEEAREQKPHEAQDEELAVQLPVVHEHELLCAAASRVRGRTRHGRLGQTGLRMPPALL